MAFNHSYSYTEQRVKELIAEKKEVEIVRWIAGLEQDYQRATIMRTLRDEFAMTVIEGIGVHIMQYGSPKYESLAYIAYDIADAMLVEREKKK